jgi:hypothetical protein
MADGRPHEIKEWRHTAVDADTGRINLLARTLARIVGLNPTQSVASVVLFEIDAGRTWTSTDKPTRGELFATAERTILQPPASLPGSMPDVAYALKCRMQATEDRRRGNPLDT